MMSVQFGNWNFDGAPPAQDYIEKVNATLAPYGPDGDDSYTKGGVKILYRAFHTTKQSHREKQPYVSPSGPVITWDGRLDNRTDLISELRDSLTVSSADVAIVAAAYERWAANCLGKLIGDWALSIWNPLDQSVLLAKDPIGTHHLFYSIEDNQVTWSTILDPLVLFAARPFSICEEYIAGWFSYFAAVHLTPYAGIHSVPPSSSVLLRPGKRIVTKYWDFDPDKRIRYRTDAEYEEHFVNALATAVQRRLRSDRPVLADLSGGMDSSSIVCLADVVIARGQAECPRLDTISWYDDSFEHIQRDTNELHWITKVEQKRGRTGCHINTASLTSGSSPTLSPFTSEFDDSRFAPTPVPNSGLPDLSRRYAACMQSQGNRVALCGIGGDEITCGGVPTPTPELQNLIARARFITLARQLNAWAVKMRTSRLSLLWDAACGFFVHPLTGVSLDMHLAPWFHPGFVCRNRAALAGYPTTQKLFGPLPSFQENMVVLNALRRLLANWRTQPEILHEVRFPYLDRDFLEFIYAIPREQLIGVGKRRFLMKRALVGIVPDELLNRKQKAFSWPVNKKVSTEWPNSMDASVRMVSGGLGIIDSNRFWEVLQKAKRYQNVPIDCVKTLTMESWLRHLTVHGVLTNSLSATGQSDAVVHELKAVSKLVQTKFS